MAATVSLLLAMMAWMRGVAVHPARASLAAAALWVWMWILIWGNSGNPDLEGYLYFYDAERTPEGVGPGYWLLVETARSVGLDYTAFLAICAAFAMLVMALVTSWFTPRTSFVAALYFLYPFVFDAIQARNMLAMSLVILAFGIRTKFPKAGWSSFVFLVVIAASIHVTMLVFLTALLARRRRHTRVASIVMWASIVAVPVVSIFPASIGPLADIVLQQLEAARFESYFATRASFGIVLFVALHLASLAVLRAANQMVSASGSQHATAESTDPSAQFVAFVYRTALVLTVLLPLVAVNSNFFRLLRNMWFLYAIAFAVGIDRQRRANARSGILIGVSLLTVANSVAFIAFDYASVLKPILENNRLLEEVGLR